MSTKKAANKKSTKAKPPRFEFRLDSPARKAAYETAAAEKFGNNVSAFVRLAADKAAGYKPE